MSLRTVATRSRGEDALVETLGVVWSLIHYLVGFSSATLSALVAANAKAKFLGENVTLALAAAAAGLAFLITALDAGKKGNQFQSASRHLERAISSFAPKRALESTILGKRKPKQSRRP